MPAYADGPAPAGRSVVTAAGGSSSPIRAEPIARSEHDKAHARRWWVLGIIGLAQLMVVLDATIVNIALPSAQHALGFSTPDRQWVVTAYSLAFGSLLLLGGRLSDYFGRKRMLLIGVAGFGVASAAGGFSTGLLMLIIARGAQGGFGAMMAPAALSLLATTFTDPSERGRAFGIFGAIAGAGGAVGLILGGLLTEYADWRWCLFVNCVFTLVIAAGAIVLLRDQQLSRHIRFDIPGLLVVVPALLGIVFGLAEAATKGWGSPVTMGPIAAGIALLGVFLLIERRSPHPLLPIRIVAHRIRGASYLAVGLAGIAVFGTFLFMTYFLQQQLGYSPVSAGLAFLPLVGALMAAAITATTRILPRYGPKLAVVPGLLAAAGGMTMLTRITLGASYPATIMPALIVLGLGIGLVMGAAINAATLGTTQQDAGIASAMVNTSQQIGGSIGTALLSTVVASATATYLVNRAPARLDQARAAIHGDITAFNLVACILLAAALVTALLYPSGKVTVDPYLEPESSPGPETTSGAGLDPELAPRLSIASSRSAAPLPQPIVIPRPRPGTG